MNHGVSMFAGAGMMFVSVAAAPAIAAGEGSPRNVATPPPSSRQGPALPAPSPAAGGKLLETRKPDYAIFLASQQEFENTALGWIFRIENLGKATPALLKETITIPGVGQIPAGSVSVFPTSKSAALVISVGQPCPNPKIWHPFAADPVTQLKPGDSTKTKLYRMPDDYAGKGCRFRAEIKGPTGDANLSNNVMHMITKTAALPDLVVWQGSPMSNHGSNLVVANKGNAPAGPSTFHFECQTSDPDKSCAGPGKPRSGKVVLDKPVPALNPGKSFDVLGFAPKDISWKATADHAKAVTESIEENNTMTGFD